MLNILLLYLFICLLFSFADRKIDNCSLSIKCFETNININRADTVIIITDDGIKVYLVLYLPKRRSKAS